jgi:hypothetical protein
MAMDLIGLNPIGIEGKHFRRNIVSWHYMWDAISALYPEIANKVEYAYSNDGDGLGKDDCLRLAELISLEMENETQQLKIYVKENFSRKGIISPDFTDFNDLMIFLEECGGFEIW